MTSISKSNNSDDTSMISSHNDINTHIYEGGGGNECE